MQLFCFWLRIMYICKLPSCLQTLETLAPAVFCCLHFWLPALMQILLSLNLSMGIPSSSHAALHSSLFLIFSMPCSSQSLNAVSPTTYRAASEIKQFLHALYTSVASNKIQENYVELLIRYSSLPLNNVPVSSRTSGDFFSWGSPENINMYIAILI